MVVIAIVGVLAAALFPTYSQYTLRANKSRANTDLRVLQKAILQLVIDSGKTPFGCLPNTPDNHEWFLNDPNAWIMVRPTFFWQPPLSNCPGWAVEDVWAWPYIQNLPQDPWWLNYYFDGDYIVCINGFDITISAVVSYGPNNTSNYPNCAANGITDDVYIKMEL